MNLFKSWQINQNIAMNKRYIQIWIQNRADKYKILYTKWTFIIMNTTLVSCFGVRVSVMFHFILLVQFGLLSGHLLENSCPLG